MKITKQELKEIIKEEVVRLLNEIAPSTEPLGKKEPDVEYFDFPEQTITADKPREVEMTATTQATTKPPSIKPVYPPEEGWVDIPEEHGGGRVRRTGQEEWQSAPTFLSGAPAGETHLQMQHGWDYIRDLIARKHDVDPAGVDVRRSYAGDRNVIYDIHSPTGYYSKFGNLPPKEQKKAWQELRRGGYKPLTINTGAHTLSDEEFEGWRKIRPYVSAIDRWEKENPSPTRAGREWAAQNTTIAPEHDVDRMRKSLEQEFARSRKARGGQ